MKPILAHSRLTIFFLTYMALVVRRSALEVWSLSKPHIETSLGFNSTLLGLFDTSYLLAYAIGEYINGILCDRIGESIVISLGLFTAGLGLSIVFLTQISLLSYFSVAIPSLFVVLWILQGYSHSTVSLTQVLPGTVSLMSAYFPAAIRGRIMGIWGTSASAGNLFGIILYTLLKENASLEWDSTILVAAGIIILHSFLFKLSISEPVDSETLLPTEKTSFGQAWLLPGVIEYTLVYSCCKFMNYAWMMWLPYYLTAVIGFDHISVGIIVALYEVGAVVGSFGGGCVSDWVGSRSQTVKVMLFFAAPCTYLLWEANVDQPVTVGGLSFGLGVSVAGVCYLINSCVSADLAVGKRQIATISGILDGTGSLVTGMGIFFVGFLQQFSWGYVFGIILAADVVAVGMLQFIQCRKKS
jgi:sugar phosphate permease